MSALPSDDQRVGTAVHDDSVPIQQLGAGSDLVRDVSRSRRPRMVTEDGVGIAVIVDAESYEAMRTDRAARELARDLHEAIAAADAGEVVDHEDVVQQLRERYAGKVPAAVLKELDGV